MNKKGLEWYYIAGLIVALVVLFIILGGAGNIGKDIYNAVKGTPDFRNEVQRAQGEEVIRYSIMANEVAYRENGEWQPIGKGVLFDSGRQFDGQELITAFDRYYFGNSNRNALFISVDRDNFYPDVDGPNLRAVPRKVEKNDGKLLVRGDFRNADEVTDLEEYGEFFVWSDRSLDLSLIGETAADENMFTSSELESRPDHKKIVDQSITWRDSVVEKPILLSYTLDGEEFDDSFSVEKIGDYLVVRFEVTS